MLSWVTAMIAMLIVMIGCNQWLRTDLLHRIRWVLSRPAVGRPEEPGTDRSENRSIASDF
jgi:hypothetical protein